MTVKWILLFAVLALFGCANHTAQTPPAPIVVVKSIKANKCKIVLPAQPKELQHPLPVNDPKTLIDILTNKLIEWNKYGDNVEKATRSCR